MGAKKNRDIPKIIEALKKLYGPVKQAGKKNTLLECFVRKIIGVGEKEEQVKKALALLKEEFVDWNEVRVTQPREIQDVLERHLQHQVNKKSHLLRDTLHQIFNLRNRMDLQFLLEKDFADIQKFIDELGAGSEELLRLVLSHSHHNPELPICQNFIRVGKRIGLWDDKTSPGNIKKQAQKILGSKNFFSVHALFFLHGERVCLPSSYDCSQCVLLQFCDWGKKRIEKQTSTKTTRKKRTQKTEKKSRNARVRKTSSKK